MSPPSGIPTSTIPFSSHVQELRGSIDAGERLSDMIHTRDTFHLAIPSRYNVDSHHAETSAWIDMDTGPNISYSCSRTDCALSCLSQHEASALLAVEFKVTTDINRLGSGRRYVSSARSPALLISDNRMSVICNAPSFAIECLCHRLDLKDVVQCPPETLPDDASRMFRFSLTEPTDQTVAGSSQHSKPPNDQSCFMTHSLMSTTRLHFK